MGSTVCKLCRHKTWNSLCLRSRYERTNYVSGRVRTRYEWCSVKNKWGECTQFEQVADGQLTARSKVILSLTLIALSLLMLMWRLM